MATHKKSSAPDPVVTNQVFFGLPWKGVLPKYLKQIDRLRTISPLSFVIVGQSDSQESEDLLAIIKKRLLTSSLAVFDATGGNANVSLEYGFAEAHETPKALYLSTRKPRKATKKDYSIISDLAGKKRNQYTSDASLGRLLDQLSASHQFTRSFEAFLTDHSKGEPRGTKKRTRALALKVIHALDGKQSVRRRDVVRKLQADVAAYTPAEIDGLILGLHRAKLIRSGRGQHALLSVTTRKLPA